MAQAAPASPASGTPRTTGPDQPGIIDDLIGERAATVLKWATPVVGGLVYGFWAAAINRDTGAITGWNVLFGFVCAIAFAAAWTGVRMMAPLMRRELHALMWMAFAGIAFGFIYSQTGATVLRSVMMSLAVAVSVFAALFYHYYTHEDAEGHRVK
ncbi:hypothetical protein ACFWFF_39500 [Streptomyces sp. NPDC060223]|uniref:hypothetical protein n=1 Tax=unclassified Streptomyces TaxID=2593676 RepID=UPI0036341631